MRKIEVIALCPETCAGARFDVLFALTKLHDFIIEGEILGATELLSQFETLWRLDLDTLRKHFNEKELKIIKIYREWHESFTQRGDVPEALELQAKLDKMADLTTLIEIMRKAIKLELPLRCLGDIKHTFIISKELKKIDNYLLKLERKEIKYETARKGISKQLKHICDKINYITEILWR